MATASVAILSTLYLRRIALPHEELVTECLCWLLILLSSSLYSFYRQTPTTSERRELNIAPLGITIICLASSVKLVNLSAVR